MLCSFRHRKKPMKPILTTAFRRRPDTAPDSEAPMRIAVAYQDTESLVQAIQFCDRIVQEYWQDFEIECTWWKLSFLQHPQLFKEAVHAATEADLILLSLPAEKPIAKTVEDWIDEWIDKRRFRPGALVSLIPGTADAGSAHLAMEGYLTEVASRSALDYFPHHLQRSEVEARGLQQISPRILESLPVEEPTPRWGINE